jgi:hypothetical protein
MPFSCPAAGLATRAQACPFQRTIRVRAGDAPSIPGDAPSIPAAHAPPPGANVTALSAAPLGTLTGTFSQVLPVHFMLSGGAEEELPSEPMVKAIPPGPAAIPEIVW